VSAEYVTLSFLKSKKINYYYQKPYIYFTCPYCCEEAKMTAKKGIWECEKCHKDGTLVTLMEFVKENRKEQKILQNIAVYNPIKEAQTIRHQFKRLIIQHGAEIEGLYQRVNNLIEYYCNQKRKEPN
jgi:ribosomal protein L37AE/L43A